MFKACPYLRFRGTSWLAASVAALVLMAVEPALAAGVLTVDVHAGYNLVVDSNATSPATYAPSAAYVGAKVCNTGDAPLADVFAYIGNYNGGTGSTPGIFPLFSSAGDSRLHIANTGDYSLTLEPGSAGASDATRYIGTLSAGECRTQYWLISYPQCVNVGGQQDYPPCAASITGGIGPEDDLSLDYDVWASTSSAILAPKVSERRAFTMRNEISAAANKIWPNTASKVPDEYLVAIESVLGWGTLGPDGQPLTQGSAVYPGQRVITTQGIWYDLGNVGQGFDNDGDLVPDQNAWLQPVGDAAKFDSGCFRMISAYGLLIVKLKTGGELLIPFQNQLYFEHLPENTGVVGLVYYQFIATSEGCTAAMTPYQESASGFDNEKFSADYGLSNALYSGSFATKLAFTKSDGVNSIGAGSNLTYTLSANNTSGVHLGAPDLGVPMVFRETIPDGASYVFGSADDALVPPSGTGSIMQEFGDLDEEADPVDGDTAIDTCEVRYSVTSSSYVILYSTDGGTVWTRTEPASGVTDIQWLLFTTLALDGGHDGYNCVAPNNLYDNGTLQASLPAGKTTTLQFRVQVAAGPFVCNTAQLTFGGADSNTTASDCTLVIGNNSISGSIFRDDGTGTGGIYGDGTRQTGETGIGAGVVVRLFYDRDGDGVVGSGDLEYDPDGNPATLTRTTSTGAFSFTNLPDGPFLVVATKYDGAVSNGSNDAATDSFFGTAGWGTTTWDPNLPLTTDQGILKLNEDLLTTTLAVNIDLDSSTGTPQTVPNVNFGFAPPLRVTKSIAGNPNANPLVDDRADTPVDEGDLITYQILLENRLPSAGVQGPTGCQYTVWAPTVMNGSPAVKEFTNYLNAAGPPNRTLASAVITGGANRSLDGRNFTIADQPGNITKVEALAFAYFSSPLTNDTLTLKLVNSVTAASSTRVFGTALIDSYIGEPPDLSPDRAISWDVTSVKPGGGLWSWTDDFSAYILDVNPSKESGADARLFYIDAIGLRITTDQDCEAGPSTTLSPVPLQDSYDRGSVSFVSANPPATSVDTATGVVQWDDVGPILPGSLKVVNVTVRALDIAGIRTGTCGPSSPPALNSTCNWADTAFTANGDAYNVYYADGRKANDASSRIAMTLQGKGELRGTIWNDSNQDGWPHNDGEPTLPNVSVTLWGCVRSSGLMETDSVSNKDCVAATGGNAWVALATTTTTASGTYEFLGLDTGYYLVEVGNTNGAPGTGNTSPYSGTQTAEPNDTQSISGGLATGTNGTCGVGCNNTWGNPAANLTSTQILRLDGAAEQKVGGINFGYHIPTAALYGTVSWDINGNAALDAGEGGLSGFTVSIVVGGSTVTTTTDSNGNYAFTGLPGGTYTITVAPPTLLTKVWSETLETSPTGTVGTLDNQIQVAVAAGVVSGPHNFAYTQVDTSAIGDSVYIDANLNGVRDPGEVGIPNITVWLYEDVDRDGRIDAGVDEIYETDVTDANGLYLFEDLPEGSYVVVVDRSDPQFPANLVALGDPDLASASIGDFIYLDADGDGLQDPGEEGIPGVVVNLYADDGDGVFDTGDQLVASAITDVDGRYLITGLTAGDYFYEVDASTLPSASLLKTGSPTTTGAPVTLYTSLATETYVDADAGFSPASDYALGNRLWHDFDGDGLQDPGEPGIPYVTITVTGGSCSPCTAVTDEAGYWIVTGLTGTPGGTTYTVAVDTADPDFPRDFVRTNPGTLWTRTITNADVMTADFGYRYTTPLLSPTGSISGRVYLDGDGDLAYDAGEARGGRTVNLLDENDNIVATTTTDSNGLYSFSGIFVGSYTVQSVDELGARYSTVFLSAAQAFPNLNVIYQTSMETVADDESSVSVDGVRPDLRQDFGYREVLGMIGDTVYWDVNESGTQDLGEPGLDGVTVRIYDAVWADDGDGYYQAGEGSATLLTSTTTIPDNPLTPANEGGTYLFSGLAPLAAGHHYLVVVDTGSIATAMPGATQTLIADPDTDGLPCTALPLPGVPLSICDSRKLVLGFQPGNSFLGADFGYRITGTGYATIGDQLWVDTDGDGMKDGGEPGVPHVTVWLDGDNDGTFDWTDMNGNGVWDDGEGERWVASDSDGYYAFTGLADGTYDLRVLTSDPDWPSGLGTTPTYEARSSNTSRNNYVQVVVGGGAVTSVVDGDGANGSDACTNCNLSVDFGYRYTGANSLSGTICVDDPSKNGYCGDTATTHFGVGTGESALAGMQVTAYRWTDDGDSNAWDVDGVIDAGDTFQLLGTASTDASGNYSFANLPDNVILVFGVPEAQNLRLTTTNASTSVEDAGVTSRQLLDGTTSYLGNLVTVFGRQALWLANDADNVVRDVDYAFDATLGGAIAYDFGDLPALYGSTLREDSGAQHKVTSSPLSIFLGASVATENDGIESPEAAANTDDNGVVMVSSEFAKGGAAWVDVTASASGWLAGWIDFDRDGNLTGPDDFIIAQPVVAGVNHIWFPVPTTLTEGTFDFFARFRIYPSQPQFVASSGVALDSTFQFASGEVEDYMFTMLVTPTLVVMRTMEAVQEGGEVEVIWSTTMEADNLGFNVYRQVAGGERQKVNRHIIVGSAFTTGRVASGPRRYRLVDREAPEGFVQYWIEDIDLNRTRTQHGPISPHRGTITSGYGTPAPAPAAAVAPFRLASEAVDSSADVDPTLGSTGGIFTTPAGMGVKLTPPSVTSTQRENQWKIAGVAAAKLVVTQPGWYRVTKQQLLDAGFDPGSNPRLLSLYSEGREIPINTVTASATTFAPADSIEFFGLGIDTPGTGGRVYYLAVGRSAGARIAKRTGRSSGAAPASFPYSFSRIERTIFEAALVNNGERENFLGAIVTTEPVSRSMTVANLQPSGNAQLEVAIQGASFDLQHVVDVKVNGTSVGTLQFDDFDREVDTLTFAASLLSNGQNTVTFTALAGDDDVSAIESLRLVYPHAFRAQDDALLFTLSAGSSVTVSGFSSPDIRVYDVTDPATPSLVGGTIGTAADATRSVTCGATGSGTRTLFAFAPARVSAPAQIVRNKPSKLNAASNAADLLIISHSSLLDAAAPLKAARQAQGLKTAVVDVTDVYDEFSFGHHGPQALREFLSRSTRWKTRPRYVILLGDASLDPRNYLEIGSYDLVPTKLVPTTWIKSASDDWFADFGGTGIPSLAMGRLPARTPAEASAMIGKIVSRSISPSDEWARRVRIVADWPNVYDFEAAARLIEDGVPSSYDVNVIPIETTPSPAAAIEAAFNEGAVLVDYIGHGTVDMWSNDFFGSPVASTLTNGNRLPVVLVMNCLNGYFHDLFSYSLAEALMKNPNGGAVAVWASSALTPMNPQLAMNLELFRWIFGPTRIGDAIVQSKKGVDDPDVRRTWIFFGDPTMRLK